MYFMWKSVALTDMWIEQSIKISDCSILIISNFLFCYWKCLFWFVILNIYEIDMCLDRLVDISINSSVLECVCAVLFTALYLFGSIYVDFLFFRHSPEEKPHVTLPSGNRSKIIIIHLWLSVNTFSWKVGLLCNILRCLCKFKLLVMWCCFRIFFFSLLSFKWQRTLVVHPS